MTTHQPNIESRWPARRPGVLRGLPWWSKFLALPLVVGFGSMTTLLVALRIAPLPDESLASPTRIETADGTRLTEWTVKGTHRQHVPLNRIPAALVQATVAVEDARFFQHHAFNPLSIARAVWVDLRNVRVLEGGSTITQQLAKNLFLSQDRTVMRKLREALYAMQLELHESKRTILEQYLNVVYYGHGAYGVGAAAEVYFNKPVQNLNLAECALLAGLPRGPGIYSPFNHFERAKERQRWVLQRMVQTGYISQREADEAYRQPLTISRVRLPERTAPYFTATAVEEAEQKYHVTPDDLYRGDISVTTTLDPVLQQAAERAIATTLPKDSGLQAALVAMDPATGAIRAMVGGRDFAKSPYNRVFAERQPGSTFKAVLYAAALEQGWSPARQVNSELTTFLYDQARVYTVHDYGEFYAHRPLTLREALARSDNVYAVTANLDIGPETVIALARRMGIESPMQPYPSLALGVFPTSPLQMASAYAVLANGGYRVTPYAVQEIRDARLGRVLQAHPQKTRVLSPQVAFQMADLLQSVLGPHGTGYSVHGYLHDLAAAKTGTTDSDAWMVGFTPTLVCAVWVGYDDNRKLSLVESHLAAPIWAKFMGTAQQRVPARWYQPPDGLVRATIDPATAKLATDTCRDTEVDYFLAGTEPRETCPLHPAARQADERRPWYRGWLFRWF